MLDRLHPRRQGDDAEKFPVRVYDLAAGKELGKFHPGLWVTSVSVSANGRRVAANSSPSISATSAKDSRGSTVCRKNSRVK